MAQAHTTARQLTDITATMSMYKHSTRTGGSRIALALRVIGALTAMTIVQDIHAQALASRSDWAAIAKWPDFMGGVWGDRGAGGPEVGAIVKTAPLKPELQAKFNATGPSPD